MRSDFYRFRAAWSIDAPAPAVFAAVVDVARYPQWWPDVRTVSKVNEDTAELVCRATLPFALTLRMTRLEQDEHTGRLGVALSGDLEGSLTARVWEGPGSATRLEILQQVVATKTLLRALSPLARPVFRANHAVMMRRGQRGLRSLLHR
ncbi:SRPBCC family protein [Saccharomonospora sp. NPDC006951]